MPQKKPHQPYDNLLKRLVENQPIAILPLLFPALVGDVLEELNIEVLLPPRRTDRVYKILPAIPQDGPYILHVEYEVSANPIMDWRLLIYHALLFEKYRLPIISIIVYPFEVRMVSSPLKEFWGTREILSFEYETLPLWKLDARTYVEQRAVPVYGLLPTMQHTSDELLLEAIDEMVQWYRNDEAHLRDELLCFRVLLERAQRLPEAELLRVERRIRMFDPLLENDPWVKEKVAEGEARGEARGKAEEARATLVRFVQRRFPALTEMARARAASLTQVEVLNALMEQLWFATDEYAARALLEAARE